MKRVLRHFVVNTSSLYFVDQLTQGLVFSKGIQTIVITGAVLTLATLVAKPIINVLLLPLNLVTFGFFRWVSSTIALYLVTLVIKNFRLEYFSYAGYSSNFMDIPKLHFEGALSFVAFSLLISIFTTFVYWLIK